MRALTVNARILVAALTALAVAGCGGTGGAAASTAAVPTAQSCQTASPFAGAATHAAVPARLFPASNVAAARKGRSQSS